MTMALSLLSGNPNRIDSCIFSSFPMLKLVIECHHLAQPFQKSLLLLQSIRKCVIVLILLQYEHMSSVFILMLLTIHYMPMFYVLLYTEMFVLKFVLYIKRAF